MISCKDYQTALSEWGPQEIEESLANQLAEHLELCTVCSEESNSFQTLIEEIRDIPQKDPGELFFRRQLKAIEKQIEAEAPSLRKKSFRPWFSSLVAAAAVLLIFIGYGRWGQHSEDSWQKDWKSALAFLAEDSDIDPMPLDLEDLNGQELDRVAKRIVNNMFEDYENKSPQRSDDWTDLNGDEMDTLLHRLQSEQGGKQS